MEPQMNTDEHRLNEITERIIGCVYVVANTLGNGFLEKVYENALARELRKSGFLVEQQKGIKVRYDGVVVGDFMVDLLVQKEVLVELKAVKTLDNIHVAQCLNYLRATGLKVCLLLNFGTPQVQIRRLIR
jgi:GxxExxY protein